MGDLAAKVRSLLDKYAVQHPLGNILQGATGQRLAKLLDNFVETCHHQYGPSPRARYFEGFYVLNLEISG